MPAALPAPTESLAANFAAHGLHELAAKVRAGTCLVAGCDSPATRFEVTGSAYCAPCTLGFLRRDLARAEARALPTAEQHLTAVRLREQIAAIEVA